MSEKKIRLIAVGMFIVLIVMIVLVFKRLGGQTNQNNFSGESVYSESSTEQTSGLTQEEREQAYLEEYKRLAQEYHLDESEVVDLLEQEGLVQYKVGGVTINVGGTSQEQSNTNPGYIDTTGKTNKQIVDEIYQSNPVEFERQFKELVEEYREEKNQAYQKAVQAQKAKGIYIEPKYLPDGTPNPRYGQ